MDTVEAEPQPCPGLQQLRDSRPTTGIWPVTATCQKCGHSAEWFLSEGATGEAVFQIGTNDTDHKITMTVTVPRPASDAPQPPGIREFYAARLEEDQQAALAASGHTVVGSPGRWQPSPAGDEWEARIAPPYDDEELLVALRPGLPRPPEFTGGYWGALVSLSPEDRDHDETSRMDVFRHAARHDPARVLAQVAAGQRLLDRHSPLSLVAPGKAAAGEESRCHGCGDTEFDRYPVDIEDCPELADAVAPWSGRPDFNPRWEQ